jgi:hypothetical protein
MFADNTTGLITGDNETAYREKVSDLAVWCQNNYLSFNISKTKQLIVDYRKHGDENAAIQIYRTAVERAERFKFLGVLFPARRLNNFGIGTQILKK